MQLEFQDGDGVLVDVPMHNADPAKVQQLGLRTPKATVLALEETTTMVIRNPEHLQLFGGICACSKQPSSLFVDTAFEMRGDVSDNRNLSRKMQQLKLVSHRIARYLLVASASRANSPQIPNYSACSNLCIRSLASFCRRRWHPPDYELVRQGDP